MANIEEKQEQIQEKKPLSYKVSINDNNNIYIETNDPNMSIDSLPDDVLKQIHDKIDSKDNRTNCSISCRLRFRKYTSGPESYYYTTSNSVARFGTCRNYCKRLLRSDDFKFDKFKFRSEVVKNNYEVVHMDTNKEMMIKMVDLSNADVIKYGSRIKDSYKKSYSFVMPILGLCKDDSYDKPKYVGMLYPKYSMTLKDYLLARNDKLDTEEIVSIAYSLLMAANELYGMDGLDSHGCIKTDNIYGFKNPCSDKLPLWMIGNFELNYKKDAKSDIYEIGTLLYKLIIKNHSIDYNLKDHVIGHIVLTMISGKSILVSSLLELFEKLDKDRKISIGGCRCSIPYSFNYISFEDALF